MQVLSVCMKSEDVHGYLTYLDQQQEDKLDGSYHEKQNIVSSFTEKEQLLGYLDT
jgi:hypothetical protein